MIRFFAALALITSVLAANAQQLPWVKIDGKDAHPTQVLAKFKEGQVVAAAAGQGFRVEKRYSHVPRVAVITLEDQAGLAARAAATGDPAERVKETMRQLLATGRFDYVEPDYVKFPDLTPTDIAFLDGRLWGLLNTGQQGGRPGADINVVRAWDISTGDPNVIVAVIDTGINYTHVDLVNQLWRNPGEIPANNIDDDNNGYIDDVFGIDAVNDNGDPNDEIGHGTHVAGTIGASANDAGSHVGVIWQVQIMSLKFFTAQGGGLTSDQIECINYAISKNARISNNSYGGYGFIQAEYDAIAAARASGHLFIASAGNAANDNDTTPHYPDGYDLDNIISVAALDRFDDLADFSNYGANSVDLGAPGVEIFSCWIGSNTAYNTIDGTSMAAPHVTGAAALLLAANSGADYSRIRDKLLENVTQIPALAGVTTTGGRLNVLESIRGRVDGILEITAAPPTGSYFATNIVTNIVIRVTDDFNVNDATVIGRWRGQNVSFLNTGVPPDANANDGRYTATLTMPSTAGFYDLTLTVTAPNKQPATEVITYEVIVHPSNDNFANARKIPSPGASVDGDNRLATNEPGEPLHAGVSNFRSLWWSWSHPSDIEVLVDTAGTTFDDSAVLAIYVGSALNSLTEITNALPTVNGPNGTRAPFVKFDATAGITYWIAVAQSGISTNSPGQVALRVEPHGEIDTTRPNLTVTNIVSGSYIRSLSNRTNLAGLVEDPPPNASGVSSVHMKVNDELIFTQIFLATNYTTFTNWSSPEIQLTNGWNTIEVTAFDRADNEANRVVVRVNYIPETGAGNDLLAMARNLPSSGGVLSGEDNANNANATKEFGEPNHAGNEGGKSLWWYFFAPSDGTLFLSTAGSTLPGSTQPLDTLLALYSQSNPDDRSVRNLTFVASNDDAQGTPTSELSAAIRAGVLYYIAVDGYAGQAGNIRLQYSLAQTRVFTVTTSASAGGTITPATASYPEFSAVQVRAIPEPFTQFNRFVVTMQGSEPVFVTQNPYTFLLRGNTTIVAEFGSRQFTEDFEDENNDGTGDFDVVWPLNTGWTITRLDRGPQSSGTQSVPSFVARARGEINSSTNTLELNATFDAGELSFDYRVRSEPNFDWFEFYIDTDNNLTAQDRVVRRSGDVDWTRFTYQLPAGRARLIWRYVKDPALFRFEDTAYIDNITLPAFRIDVPAPVLTPALTQAGQFQLMIDNPSAPNQSYEVQRALSLGATAAQTTWETVATVRANTFGTAVYTEQGAPARAFYRVLVD